jgi:hypothetical protein
MMTQDSCNVVSAEHCARLVELSVQLREPALTPELRSKLVASANEIFDQYTSTNIHAILGSASEDASSVDGWAFPLICESVSMPRTTD